MSNQEPSTGESGFQPPSPPNHQPVVARSSGNGQLTAAGVLQIIEGAVTAIVGLWLFSVTQSTIGGIADDLSGGTLTFIAILCLVMAAALIWTAILCIKGRKGGWVTVIVFQSIFTIFWLLGFVSEPSGGIVLPLAYCGSALYCAIVGGRATEK